mmetsp:Transcript_23440/g.39213  ORF Transcript_23440/g.39213 Transcript_23440/m.39213 type:complete len:617 (+) Transcript_23440:218-2068(+)|eukprot:CAMPEP_0198227108 /NCGR_PEP_ID=MMETSP1445-20131203/107930_1 /TAXON_ID=36898 /ORGANISM="Pyramimonas sp., Strain CCMP2087" /LENGTH=616 /DNA_ID=CAMNT_0043907071 /DNA_START=100 /DNA_END=1950 /DNA_ORIENTATION=-
MQQWTRMAGVRPNSLAANLAQAGYRRAQAHACAPSVQVEMSGKVRVHQMQPPKVYSMCSWRNSLVGGGKNRKVVWSHITPEISRHQRGRRAPLSTEAHAHACAASTQEVKQEEPNYGGFDGTQFLVFNTMTKQKEVFKPREGEGKSVGLYVCGVTVYDFSHIGHARAYVAFDILYRHLLRQGYDVKYVRNFTDVDDKIIKRAAESGVDPIDLTIKFIGEFHTDVAALNCLPPSVEPKVTENIDNIISMIGTIIEKGHAYPLDGDVYFSVPSLENYGSLSGRKLDDNRAGERVSVDSRKQNSADFALWKGAKEGEIRWDSPWGPGRPGWHIECSAMSLDTLGPIIDIHGGGADLIFPHHENELAQSRAACSHSHVRYWMHNGFVTVDSEKMSKSVGNFFTIREVLNRYHPMALRWLLLGTQYRAPINYSKRGLEEASDRIYYLYQTLCDTAEVLALAASAANAPEPAPAIGLQELEEMEAAVNAGMNDDLNTPQVAAALSTPLKVINELLHTKKGRKTADRIPQLLALRAGIIDTMQRVGLSTEDPPLTLSEMRTKALVRAGLTEEEVFARIESRKALRGDKQYEAADQVRVELEACGVVVMDSPQGTTWRPTPVLD